MKYDMNKKEMNMKGHQKFALQLNFDDQFPQEKGLLTNSEKKHAETLPFRCTDESPLITHQRPCPHI